MNAKQIIQDRLDNLVFGVNCYDRVRPEIEVLESLLARLNHEGL